MVERKQIPSKPRIVVVTGAKAAGKDELAEYLVQQHGALAIEVGAFARKLAEEAKEDEPSVQYDTSAKKMAEHGSEHVIYRLIAEITENDRQSRKPLVITGIRTPAEAAVLKKQFDSDLLLTYVKVGDREARYDRVQSRDFATDPDSFQDFVEEDERLKSEYALPETAVHADITLWNDGSLETYYRQIETHIVPHLFPERSNTNE